jgi:hypothetical protein
MHFKSTWLDRWAGPVLSLFLSVFFVCGIAAAQVAITGKITGVVTDSSGAVVPDATVTVTSSAQMAPRSAKSASDGAFLFDLLSPGDYQVTVTAGGFQTYNHTGIVITPGFTASVSPRLQLGDVAQTITVTSEPVVDVQSATVSMTFDQTLLQQIPSGRDPWSTVAQTAGATSSSFDVGGNFSYQQSAMQIHGSTPFEQLYSYNGLDLNNPNGNGGFTQFYTGQDDFQEFQVVTDAAPASVPIGGIYMNMVTKSGSNELHGLAATYYETAATAAGSNLPTYNGLPVNAGSPLIHGIDSTAQLGGPIIKDRWWLFGSYQRYDLRSDILSVRLPNGQPIFDNNHQTNTVLRSDWQLNPKNRVSFVWLYNETNRFARRSTTYQFVDFSASSVQIEPEYILEGLWTSQVTSNLLFDTRFGFCGELFPLRAQPGTPATAVSTADLTLSTLKGAPANTSVSPARTYRFEESGSYYKPAWHGNHNFKFGYEFGMDISKQILDANQGIDAFYNNGVPLQVTAFNYPLHFDNRFNFDDSYVEDNWTMFRRLTVNLGVRFEHWVTYWPQQSNPAGYFPDLFPTRTFPAQSGVVDWNNAAPRIGVAFDPDGRGKQVIRFSFGRYYLLEGAQLASAINPNSTASETFLWNGAVNSQGVPLQSEWDQPGNLISKTGGIFTHIDPNLSRPYSDEYTVGYQVQIWQDLALSVAYYHRHMGDLLGTENLAAPSSAYTPITTLNGAPIVNGVTGQPMTLYNLNKSLVGQTNNLITTQPLLNDNSYNGVEFGATKRLSHNFSVNAGFTVQAQKGQFIRGSANEALSDNLFDPNLNINRANNYLNQDSTYVFKLDGIYNLPWGFGSSVNFQHYTGYPLQPTEVFKGLNQGNETVILQPNGTIRLPSVNMLNLRLSKTFTFQDRYKVEPLVDFLNTTNAQTVVAEVTSFGPTYLKPSNTINPFIARFGLRFEF